MKVEVKNMLRCRDLGHDWHEHISINRKNPEWGKRRELLCGNCGTVRLELINAYGEVGSRHYEYNDDYRTVTQYSKREARAQRIFNSRAKTPKQIKARQAREKIINGTR